MAIPALLLAAACAQGSSAQGTPQGAPSAAPTQDACRALTAADVRAALGVEVNQLPMTSTPPGGGPDTSLVSGCTYASATAASAGASLYLYRDMPIDSFANVPGIQRVPGIGDTAFMQPPMLIGRKGHITFQLTVVSQADPATKELELRTLAREVAARL